MRQRRALRQLAEFMERPAGAGPLWSQHQRNSALQRYVRARLPGFLAERCLACVARDDQLTIYTDAPAAATPLRFALPSLLPELQTRFDARLRRIRVRALHDYSPAVTPRPARIPGRSVIRNLRQAADHCPVPELRSALLRLAATCQDLKR